MRVQAQAMQTITRLTLALATVVPLASPALVSAQATSSVEPFKVGTFEIVHQAGDTYDTSVLMVRSLGEPISRRLEATASLSASSPFISPDNEWVGFFDADDRSLRRVLMRGGASIVICNLPGGEGGLRGASWGRDGTIVFGTSEPSGLWRVSAASGEPTEITQPDGTERHLWPEIILDGRAVVFTIMTTSLDDAQLAVLDLGTGEQRVLVRRGHAAKYASSGHLVYAAEDSLWAVAFDRERLIATTTPVPVVDSVGMKPLGGAPNFSVSETGSLVYVPGAAAASGLGQRTLAWVDRDGIPLVSSSQAPDDVLPTGDYTQVRLSPDGRWAALQLGIGGGTDIALIDFSTAIRTPFAADDGIDEVDPVWSPDGSRVAFSTNRGGEIRVKRVGSESHTVLLKHDGGGPVWLEDWSPDGQWLLYRIVNDVYGLSMEGEEVLLNDSPSVKDEFRFSPNGRRISYEESAASGRPEVFVVEFPTWANKRKVSSDGGGMARWTRGGRELVYVDLNSVLHSVDVGEGEETIEISRPIPLFDLPVVSARVGMDMYDVSLDGERFVNIESDGFDPPVEVVLNWDQELLERVPHP